MKKLIIAALLLTFLSGCADTVTFEQAQELTEVGFWYGLWHGMTMPFAWVGSLLFGDIAIYAIYNNGGWYDFGFFMGIGGLGGGAASSKK